MSDRPKIPVVVRRRAASPESTKDGPEPSGTKLIPTPARGIDRSTFEPSSPGTRDLDRPRRDAGPRRAFFAPNAISAPRESSPTPSRPIMRDAPVGPVSVRTFGSSRRNDRPTDRSKRLRSDGVREIKPPTPPKPRPPLEVFPLDELTVKVLRAVVDVTARNTELPQASTDPEFVPGATYRDLRRVLSLAWPDVRDAVQRARPYQVLRVARFFGRFGPVFVISEYGEQVLSAAEAGQPTPEPPPGIAAGLERARAARARWDADHE